MGISGWASDRLCSASSCVLNVSVVPTFLSGNSDMRKVSGVGGAGAKSDVYNYVVCYYRHFLGRIACTGCKDAASCCRRSVVCVSVCWSQNGRIDRDAICIVDSGGPRNHVRWRGRIPLGKGQFFFGGGGVPPVKSVFDCVSSKRP